MAGGEEFRRVVIRARPGNVELPKNLTAKPTRNRLFATKSASQEVKNSRNKERPVGCRLSCLIMSFPPPLPASSCLPADLRPHDLDGPTFAHAILASKELIVRLS